MQLNKPNPILTNNTIHGSSCIKYESFRTNIPVINAKNILNTSVNIVDIIIIKKNS